MDQTRDSVASRKLAKRIRRQVGQAIADFNLINTDDHVMLCLSGGKDSFTLLDTIVHLQRKSPVPFRVTAVNLDQKQPDFPSDILPRYCANHQIEFQSIVQDTYSVVKRVIPSGRTYCSLCSRLRRGALYSHAKHYGFTKIALGHHRDDLIVTFFLNLFYQAKIASIPPKLLSDDGQHTVIRPLVYVAEKDIVAYAALRKFPIIPCNLCGSQEHLQRRAIAQMLHNWQQLSPGRLERIAKALTQVRPSHLADSSLFNFRDLGRRPSDRSLDTIAWLTGQRLGEETTDQMPS